MTNASTSGREPITIVRIDQPYCANAFGVAPCTASAASGLECFNTFATCQDTNNFSRTTIPLYFSMGNSVDLNQVYLVTEDGEVITTEDGEKILADTSFGADYIIPSLVRVSTQPTKINLAGANPNATGLGNRAVCTLTFQDHPHTDRIVDPYVDTRNYTPYSQGSFWSKWIKRNKYRQNILITVYEGYVGQELSAMLTRKYFMQSVSGPDSKGNVTIQGKDVLAKLEERKAQAPEASPGVLYIAINDSVTSFEVAGAVLADYPSAGTIRIDSELMTYSATSLTANGVTFNITGRGTDGTTAEGHSDGDSVQECVRYTDQSIADILEDLLEVRAGIPAEYLNKTGWATEIGTYLAAYRLTTIITEPTAVAALVSAMQIECQFYAWWDERTALVEVKAIRGIDAELDTLTQEANIIEGSFSIADKPEQRASQVWIYHDTRNFTKGMNDIERYKVGEIIVNLGSEGDNQYGEASVRKIFSRFLQSSALAQTTATRILNRYVDIPRECRFMLDAKDRTYWVGDTVTISHRLDVDFFGARESSNWTITSAEEIVSGEKVRYTAEDTTIYGVVHYIMAAGAADFPGYDAAPFKNFYIGDADGLLSDGSQCGKIS